MAYYANNLRQIAIKKETSFGTGGTYGNFIDLTSLSADSDTGSVPADNSDAYNGQEGATTCQLIGDAYQSARISLSGLLNPVTFPFFQIAGIGADAVTETEAGTVYLHTTTGTREITQNLATLAIADNRGGEAFESVGLKVNTMAIKLAGEDQPLTFDASLIGKQISKDFDFATATSGASCSAIPFFTWSNASFIYNSGTAIPMRNFTFNIDNGLTEFRNGASTLSEPKRTKIGGTGTMDLVFEDDSWHGLLSTQTLADMVVTATGASTIGSASNPEFVLTIPKFRILNAVSNDSKSDLHIITVEFEAIGNEANSGIGFTMSMQNLTASY